VQHNYTTRYSSTFDLAQAAILVVNFHQHNISFTTQAPILATLDG